MVPCSGRSGCRENSNKMELRNHFSNEFLQKLIDANLCQGATDCKILMQWFTNYTCHKMIVAGIQRQTLFKNCYAVQIKI